MRSSIPRSPDRTCARLKPWPPPGPDHTHTQPGTRPCTPPLVTPSHSPVRASALSPPPVVPQGPSPPGSRPAAWLLLSAIAPLRDSPFALLDIARFGATSIDYLCHIWTTSLVVIDWACAPQVRHASPTLHFEVLYFFQYFPHLFPLPSGSRLGRLRGRLDWIETVVQSIRLIVELPSTTHGLMPARTWTWRTLGLTRLDAFQEFQRQRAGR